MPARVTKVCCQGCGADLEVNEAVRFVTCNFCGSRLEVVHDTTTTHTRLLDAIHRTTTEMAGNLRVIELQNDLELLDRNWDRYREACLSRGKDGELAEPNLAMAQVIGVGSFVLGGLILLFCLFNWNGGKAAYGLIWVTGFVVFGTYHLTMGSEKARSFEGAKLSYSMRRAALLRAIQEARGSR